jgi:hypothetical protein
MANIAPGTDRRFASLLDIVGTALADPSVLGPLPGPHSVLGPSVTDDAMAPASSLMALGPCVGADT